MYDLPRVLGFGLGVCSVITLARHNSQLPLWRGGLNLQGWQQAKTAVPSGRAFWLKVFVCALSATPPLHPSGGGMEGTAYGL